MTKKHEQKISEIKVDGMKVVLSRKDIIPNLTLEPIKSGRVTSILGANGAGKSTFMRALAGLEPMKKGKIFLDDEDVCAMSRAKRAQRIVYVPQTLPPAVQLYVLEAIMIAAETGGRNLHGEDVLAESKAILRKLDAEFLAEKRMDQLSGGQRQLVGIAQALVRAPKVLLLDEPLSALDLRRQVQIMHIIKHETERRNLISMVIIHDLNMALRETDDAVYLKNGRVKAQGNIKEITNPNVLSDIYGVAARLEQCGRGKPYLVVDGVSDDIFLGAPECARECDTPCK